MLFMVSAQVVCAQTLTLRVAGVEKGRGPVLVALFSSSVNDFLRKPVRAARVEAKDSIVTWTCENLPQGAYAVALFQDANSNGRLDTDGIGIPVEKYGFSNNVIPTRGAPSFDECRFELKGDTAVTVRLVP